MNTQLKKLAAVFLCASLAACSAEFDNPVNNPASYSEGDADFSKFVSIGDSLTAGRADGALYRSAQENSFPAILAQQFAMVGGGAFTQPLMDDDLGGLLFGGNTNPAFGNRLVLDASSNTPVPLDGDPTTEVFNVLTGPFNNVGVSGAKSFHLVAPGYGDPAGLQANPVTANPYYVRFASSATSTIIGDAAAQQPSFIVLWIGNNDILSYATSGGVGVDQNAVDNTNPAAYGSDDITDDAVFANTFSGLIATLKGANSAVKGVLVNLPDVKAIPFFTTVPYNPIPLDQAKADALNAAYATYNGGLQQAQQANLIDADELARRTINFVPGQNAVVILDESLTDLTGINPALINLRQATAEDLIVLTASSKIGTEATPGDPTTVWGLGTPLQDGDVLIPDEINAIETARQAFNATIKAAADGDPDFVLFDVAALMDEVKDSGLNYGTGFVDNRYATGGAFSLDGVHPTARGYAIIANAIIDVINSGFNANIPKVDPGAYTTIFIK